MIVCIVGTARQPTILDQAGRAARRERERGRLHLRAYPLTKVKNYNYNIQMKKLPNIIIHSALLLLLLLYINLPTILFINKIKRFIIIIIFNK